MSAASACIAYPAGVECTELSAMFLVQFARAVYSEDSPAHWIAGEEIAGQESASADPAWWPGYALSLPSPGPVPTPLPFQAIPAGSSVEEPVVQGQAEEQSTNEDIDPTSLIRAAVETQAAIQDRFAIVLPGSGWTPVDRVLPANASVHAESAGYFTAPSGPSASGSRQQPAAEPGLAPNARGRNTSDGGSVPLRSAAGNRREVPLDPTFTARIEEIAGPETRQRSEAGDAERQGHKTVWQKAAFQEMNSEVPPAAATAGPLAVRSPYPVNSLSPAAPGIDSLSVGGSGETNEGRTSAGASGMETRLNSDIRSPASPVAVAVRELSLSVTPGGAERVEVQVVERKGAVQVAVRAADPDLADSLRRHLGDLVEGLERSGYRAETWTGSEETSSIGSLTQSPDAGLEHDRNPGGEDEQSRWSGGEDERRHHRRQQSRDEAGSRQQRQQSARPAGASPWRRELDALAGESHEHRMERRLGAF